MRILMKKQQRGGTILGFILGLVIGLGAAFGVAIYVSKVPVPFVDKACAVRAKMKSRPRKTKTGTLTRRCTVKTQRAPTYPQPW